MTAELFVLEVQFATLIQENASVERGMWLSTEFARTRTHGPSFCPATLAGMAKDAVVTRSVRMECVNANTIISCKMDIAGILVGKILRS